MEISSFSFPHSILNPHCHSLPFRVIFCSFFSQSIFCVLNIRRVEVFFPHSCYTGGWNLPARVLNHVSFARGENHLVVAGLLPSYKPWKWEQNRMGGYTKMPARQWWQQNLREFITPLRNLLPQ